MNITVKPSVYEFKKGKTFVLPRGNHFKSCHLFICGNLSVCWLNAKSILPFQVMAICILLFERTKKLFISVDNYIFPILHLHITKWLHQKGKTKQIFCHKVNLGLRIGLSFLFWFVYFETSDKFFVFFRTKEFFFLKSLSSIVMLTFVEGFALELICKRKQMI